MHVLLNSKWKRRGCAPYSQKSRSAAKVAKQPSVSAGFGVLRFFFILPGGAIFLANGFRRHQSRVGSDLVLRLRQ